MKHGIGSFEVVRQANPGTGLHRGIHQVEIVVTQTEVNSQIADRREVILDVSAGLPAPQTSTEAGEHIRIATAVKKETLVFPQTHQIHSGLEKIAMPVMRKVALDA